MLISYINYHWRDELNAIGDTCALEDFIKSNEAECNADENKGKVKMELNNIINDGHPERKMLSRNLLCEQYNQLSLLLE